MARLIKQIDVGNTRFPITNPLPPRFLAMQYLAMQEELMRTKKRLAELEGRTNMEKPVVIRDITREDAKCEIRQLFQSGRTLYYSDIADELALDLEMVVDICREFQGNKEIGIDEDALARTQ